MSCCSGHVKSRGCCTTLQVTDRLSADRLVIIAPKEWEEGKLRVKDLNSREEADVTLQDLLSQ